MMECAVPGAVLWTWQTSDIMLAVTAVGSSFIALDFMLIPLSMAYFVTFMMLPFFEAFSKRPFNCPGGKVLCEESAPWTRLMPVYEDEEQKTFKYDDNRNIVLERKTNPGSDDFFEFEEDEEGNQVLDDEGKPIRKKDSKGRDIKVQGVWAKELVMLGKMPHMLACLLTLFASFGTVIGMLIVVGNSFADFADNEAQKAADGQPTIKDDLYKMGNEFIDQLELDGVTIVRPRECYKRNVSETVVVSDLRDTITVQSGLFNGATSKNEVANTAYSPTCLDLKITNPITAAVKNIPVRTYDPDGFRCNLDWEKVIEPGSIAKAVCAFDTLSVAAVQKVDADGVPAPLSTTGSNQQVLEDCVDAFIGLGAYDSFLTGDVVVHNASDPEPSLTFLRALAGLTQSSMYLSGAGDVDQFYCDANVHTAPGAGASEEEDQVINKICSSMDEATDGTALDPVPAADAPVEPAAIESKICKVLSGSLEEPGSEADCLATELCTYVPAYTKGFGSKAKAMPSECVLSSWVADSMNNATDRPTYATVCQAATSDSGCTTQQEFQRTFYLNQLNSMRAEQPTTAMQLGIRFYNFTETMSQTPDNCTKEDLFKDNEDGEKWDDFLNGIGAIGAVINDTILVLLLGVYILMERSPELPENRVVLEIEAMVKNYINLKVMLSAVTGVFVAGFLIFCEVQLAMVFGLLAFMLNFIPCVGSAIACFLPLPLIILDDNLSETDKMVAFLGPASVQVYVGNALEPALFGKSLNLTEISVLNALVLCQLCWGLSGAVLSVPMLGILKIVCHHTEHPMAKYTLAIIRADPAFP
jgi:predicted PurR-regulated permease PerM